MRFDINLQVVCRKASIHFGLAIVEVIPTNEHACISD